MLTNRRGGSVLAMGMVAGIALPAGGADLYVCGDIGEVYLGDTGSGDFVYFGGVCLAGTHALAADETTVYAGDVTGGILRLDLETGDLMSLYFVPGDATDLVVHDGDLLVSSSSGDIHRVDPETGDVESTITAPTTIEAMAIDGDTLFISGTIGVVYEGDAFTGGFEVLGGQCLAEVQALAFDEQHVYAGDVGGGVLTLDRATGDIANLYWVDEGITAMALEGDDLLVSSADGVIRRVDTPTGKIIGTMTAPIAVEAIELRYAAADLDQDGLVGIADLLALLAAWGPCPGCPADLDGDGAVGIGDLLALLASWG